MSSPSCADKIQDQLSQYGISKSDIHISYETGIVTITTDQPSSLILNSIEKTGIKAVLKGYGSATRKNYLVQSLLYIIHPIQLFLIFIEVDKNLGAAVAMLGGSTGYSKLGINGVVRFVQINNDECIVDGTIDGLSPGKHGIHIYECGDLSNGCDRFELFK